MQKDRDISIWSSLYELISANYDAAPLYTQTYADRHWGQAQDKADLNMDLIEEKTNDAVNTEGENSRPIQSAETI